MTISGTNAIILWSRRLDETVNFYRALGLPVQLEIHNKGSIPRHYACELGSTHFAIFEAQEHNAVERESGGCTQIGFEVSNVDEDFVVAKKTGAKVVREPADTPWRRRSAVVCDPDGRRIELSCAL